VGLPPRLAVAPPAHNGRVLSDTEQRLMTLAAENYGVFSFDQAINCGVSREVRRERVRSGRWERLHRGVYRVRGQPSSFEQRLVAAIGFNGPGTVASHRAAARLWDIPGFSAAPVEVTKPRGRSQRRSYGWLHGSMCLPATHVTDRSGVPVTTPARTVFDLAGIVHPKRAERALDSALNAGLVSLGQIERVFADLERRGRRGTVLMRELLEPRGDGYLAPASDLEALGRAVLREAELPDADSEVNLGDARSWIGRVDLTYRASLVVLELDSRRHHEALLDRDSDRRRDNRLHATGWRVLRYSWWDLTERPDVVAAEVRAALAVAA
jgi:hypothetical protein